MQVTVRNHAGWPAAALEVKVDGASVGNTDSAGQVAGAAGYRLEVAQLFKGEFDDLEDREVWVDAPIGISPPPPPPGGP